MLETALFVGFPYLAVGIAVLVGVYRFRVDRYSFSSYSSQFLENRKLFWGSVPWHYGVVLVLTAHLLALLVPPLWSWLLNEQIRLYVLEITGWALALISIFGLTLLIVRRILTLRVMAVTTRLDWLLLAALLLQVILGFSVAFFYRWGSAWYMQTAVPWLWSLAMLNPQPAYVRVLPPLIQLHFLNGFFIILILPFTRLVHFLSFPLAYLWRPHQVVIWNRHRRTL